METHQQLTRRLKKVMRSDYHSIHPQKNPVALALLDLSNEGLQNVVHQYTIFPRNIVSFLDSICGTARERGWDEVAGELRRNIGEELGSETKGIPHYDLLIKGIADGIDRSLESYLRTLSPSKATASFIDRMHTITNDRNLLYAIGGTYALESSAVPELVIVRSAVNELFTRHTKKAMPDGHLKDFFARHLGVWEPGHEEGLRTTTDKYILTVKDQTFFEEGFRDVMATMDIWWTGLYQESYHLLEEIT